MILIMIAKAELAQHLQSLLESHGVAAQVVNPRAKDAVTQLYQPDIVAAVVDVRGVGIPENAWLDMLASLGRRIPVVVTGRDARHLDASRGGGRIVDSLSWLKDPSAEDIVSLLDACGAVGVDHKRFDREKVPLFNPQVPLHMLQNNSAISLLVIDASAFRKIAIEYGSEAYHRVQECFNQLLFELWGTPGSFRAADILMRRSHHSNTYYIFLEQSRTASAVPAPAILERLADRIVVRLTNAFWREIFVERSKRMLPDCIDVVPDLSVGFATTILNPCVDALELIDQVMDQATECAKLQLKRGRDRQRELMQTLIQTPGLLKPNYQAVFRLPDLTREMVDQSKADKSLKPLEPLLFGFESLIRVRAEGVEALNDANGLTYIEPRFLRPDVLFALAHQAKVGLELDQSCLHQAVLNSANLPGMLLVNILPRNLYNIDKLRHLIMDRRDLMFEVSETEAINNFDLMMKVREQLERMDMRIAADDFGRGYSGLEQIIKIKPDLIKLDRSLIQDIHKDESKQAFVGGLVRAAQIAKSTILAEGVELWEEAVVLKAMGIDLIQGFLLHRPQAVEGILKDLDLEPAAAVNLNSVA